MIRPPKELAATIQQLACRLISEPCVNTVQRLVESNGIPVLRVAAEHNANSAPRDQRRVGIWQQESNGHDCSLVRTSIEPARLWADVDRIPPKGEKKRVVLLGESVARAYFYDPHFTFAAALSDTFHGAGIEDLEIVDLARTDLTPGRLLTLLNEVPVLSPDLLVVFAGNNWMLNLDPPNFSVPHFEQILRSGGSCRSLQEYCDLVLRQMARDFKEACQAFRKHRDVPIVFVIPEFNLLDWRNEKADQSPFLGSNETMKWEDARRSGLRALGEGDISRAADYAQEMIHLDCATTPAGFELLSRCALQRSIPHEARQWLQIARDAGRFLPIVRSPRCYSVVQEELRHWEPSQNIRVVDLPKIFTEYLGGQVPGRRLFLDYCHLTVEGLRVAAASTGDQVLTALQRHSPGWWVLSQVNRQVPPDVLAEALFHAALHNAHSGQSLELIEWQCRQALAFAPETGKKMRAYVEAAARKTPSLLCVAMKPIAEKCTIKDAVALQLFNSLPPLEKHLNRQLLEKLVQVLDSASHTPPLNLEHTITVNHCIGTKACNNLLERASCSTSLEDWDARNTSLLYRARTRECIFTFYSCRERDLIVDLTVRSAQAQLNSHVDIVLNGVTIGSLTIGSNWESCKIAVRSNLTRRGENLILVRWPGFAFSAAQRLQKLLEELQSERFPTAQVVYGELAQLRIAVCSPDETCDHTALLEHSTA